MLSQVDQNIGVSNQNYAKNNDSLILSNMNEKLFQEHVTYLKEAIKLDDSKLISEVRSAIMLILDLENCKRIVETNPSTHGAYSL